MDTLALDRDYTAVGRLSWQRAITLIFQGKAEIIEEYEDREIRSVTYAIKMPSVIRFLRALRSRKRQVKFSRENVYTRDRGKCQYCRNKVSRPEATYDHVVPRAQGGKTEWTNIVISCMDCNQKKRDRTPEQAGMKLAEKPVRPRTLPDTLHLTFTWQKGMPESWRSWLRDMTYWHGELDHD